MIGFKVRVDGQDPSSPLPRRAAVRLLRQKLGRYPAGKHYRVDGGPLRFRADAIRRARRKLRTLEVRGHISVLCDYAAHHTVTVQKVDIAAPEPTGGDKLVLWAEDRIGTPYVLGGASDAGLDCSGETMRGVDYATDGKLILDHFAASQWTDKRMKHIPLDQAVPGDLAFFHGPAPAHVAPLHSKDSNGMWWVIDEEPGTESYNGVFIAGGLRLRPCAPGYYVGLENLVGIARWT